LHYLGSCYSCSEDGLRLSEPEEEGGLSSENVLEGGREGDSQANATSQEQERTFFGRRRNILLLKMMMMSLMLWQDASDFSFAKSLLISGSLTLQQSSIYHTRRMMMLSQPTFPLASDGTHMDSPSMYLCLSPYISLSVCLFLFSSPFSPSVFLSLSLCLSLSLPVSLGSMWAYGSHVGCLWSC